MSQARITTTYQERRAMEKNSRDDLAGYQLARLNRLFEEILPENKFYQRRLSSLRKPLSSLAELAALPFTIKEDLVDSIGNSNVATNHTYDVGHYNRFHRTSGTQGNPLVVLDDQNDWQWWIDTWQFVLDSARVTENDRLLMAFSFGPFIGFWSAFDAAVARGALCIPSGGLSSLSRIELIQSSQANVLFCTPSYALHLAEVASENEIEIRSTSVDRIVVAGEPGGSIPEIKQRIEQLWQAQVIDHSGASEVGPWGFADPEGHGLYVNESEFIAEFISIENGKTGADGELCELVLTNLGRFGCPVIRYRTGDLVRPTWHHDQPCRFVFLKGGVLGRSDDMMIVRGVNIFPSSIERILRSFPEIVEYRITVRKEGQMDQIQIEIEDELENPERVAKDLMIRLGLRVDVLCVPNSTLPRFDLKGKRFVDKR